MENEIGGVKVLNTKNHNGLWFLRMRWLGITDAQISILLIND